MTNRIGVFMCGEPKQLWVDDSGSQNGTRMLDEQTVMGAKGCWSRKAFNETGDVALLFYTWNVTVTGARLARLAVAQVSSGHFSDQP
jgi:hypothetical protein